VAISFKFNELQLDDLKPAHQRVSEVENIIRKERICLHTSCHNMYTVTVNICLILIWLYVLYIRVV